MGRVIVCGGRDFSDMGAIASGMAAFEAEHGPVTVLIHGNARGADTQAGIWATLQNRTSRPRIQIIPVPARWAEDGKRAGPIRNARMLGMGADAVIAFPGGKGTADMVMRAKRAGVFVFFPSTHEPAGEKS
jgi:predicted Rossmann-fold nucleotide-binding protein